MDWRKQVRAAFARAGKSADDDVVEELAGHAAAECEMLRAEGLAASEANARVAELVQCWADKASGHRAPRRTAVVEPPPASDRRLVGIALDLRYGFRLLRRQPAFTLLAVITIALGIAATGTLFSVVYGILLKPLPWPDADRLVRVYETRFGGTSPFGPIMTNGGYRAWIDRSDTLEGLAAWTSRTLIYSSPEKTERIPAAAVTASLFPMLRSAPILGALFSERDEIDGTLVVLSWGFWQERFGGARDVIGRTIELEGRAYTVSGVMPAHFSFPDRETRLWIPFHVPSAVGPDNSRGKVSMFQAMGRLRPNATASQASAEGTARSRALPDLSPMLAKVMGGGGPVQVTAIPVIEDITSGVRSALLAFLAAVGLLYLTAVANVTGMQLARAASRSKEIAIRSAIGAGAGRLTRQLLIENLLLGLSGGGLGILLTIAFHKLLPSMLPADFPRIDDITLNAPVILFLLGLSVFASTAAGLLPALHARRLNIVEAITETGMVPQAAGRSGVTRLRSFIMAGQVAIAAVLLAGAILLGRSFLGLLQADRGYEPAHVLTARITLPGQTMQPGTRAALFDGILERVRSFPGVRHAGVTDIMPLTARESSLAFSMPPRPGSGSAATSVQANARIVSPGYFQAVAMRIREGRALGDEDTATSEPVVVVNRTFARRYLGAAPIDARLPAGLDRGRPDPERWRVVGVVDDVRQQSVTESPRPEIFVSYRQLSTGPGSEEYLLIRTAGSMQPLAKALQEIVRAADKSIVLESVLTMDERLLSTLARPRLYAVLLGAFAVFTVLIAGVGLFGVLSYSVARRRREIGVRTALGARPIDVLWMILREGLLITIAGIAIGLMVAAATLRLLGAALYGVTATDPETFIGVAALLIAVALAACIAPARRAAAMDPLRALKSP